MLKSFTFYFIIVLAYIQYTLWIGWGGWFMVWNMQKDMQQLQQKNTLIKAKNDNLKQQIEDLKQGNEGLEDLARIKLGMIKADELLVKVQNNTSNTENISNISKDKATNSLIKN